MPIRGASSLPNFLQTLFSIFRRTAPGVVPPGLLCALFLLPHICFPSILAADDCRICHQRIEGRYFEFSRDGDRILVCESCRKNHPPCSLCRLPAADGETISGRIFCPDCAREIKKRPRCSLCDALILEGTATVFPDRGLTVCAACRRERPACRLCHIPLGRPGDGEEYCQECQARRNEAPRCLHCGRVLLESHMVYRAQNGEESAVCQDCCRRYPPCSLCGIPAREAEIIDGRRICVRCRGQLDCCVSCGRPMVMMTSFLLSRGVYCRDCLATHPACDSCGAPVPAGAGVLPDGRSICSSCRAEAVSSQAEVETLFAPIRRLIETSLDLPVRAINGIHFADRQEMLRLARNLPAEARRRMEDAPSGLFERRGEEWRIHVLPWQRRDVLQGVLAHEFAHALLAEYFPGNDRLEEIEGFCEWIRYKVMKKLGDGPGMTLLETRTDFYGRAFRQVLEREKTEGPRGVFRWIGRFEEGPLPGRFGR